MAVQRAIRRLPPHKQPTDRRFSSDKYETQDVLRCSERVTLQSSTPTIAEPVDTVLFRVDGGSLFLSRARSSDSPLVDEFLSKYPNGAHMFWFRGVRSLDGRRKKLSMRPPVTHRIRVPGVKKMVWVKEFSWRGRFLIVG